jgi:putative tryptophan/tyrosine transport system substrate-binding protein
MKRREFVTLLVGGAVGFGVARPLAAGALPHGRVPTIGFLGTTSAAAWKPWTAAFLERLGELGWVDGRTVTIAYRWADGRTDRFGEIAAEFAQLHVDVILTSGSAVLQTEKATSTIPIVFALASDPVGTGMVKSLARPGGNATGLSLLSPDLAGKRLGLFREGVPKARRVAVLANVGYPASAEEMSEVVATAGKLGLEAVAMDIRRSEDIEPAFTAVKDRADALYVCGSDALVNTNRGRIAALALAAHLPTMYGERQYVEAGGLMSYGPAVPEMFRRAAELVDKILRGAKPADIPVEDPTKFELVINLKAAKSLGLEISESFLARADQVIE